MIYVFKTSVNSKKKRLFIKPILDEILPNSAWNFALDDKDNILRIESEQNLSEIIVKALNKYDFNCNELH